MKTPSTYDEYLKEALNDPNSFESYQLNMEIENEMYLLHLRNQARREADKAKAARDNVKK